MKNAIILCSGGLDSVVTANYIKKILKYQKIKILFFNYSQKSLVQERLSSKRCCKNIKGEFIEIDLKWLGEISSSLINKKGKIEKIKREDLKNTQKENEKWYVPCRNTIFLSYALALAEAEFVKKKEVNDIFVGFKCEGKEPYPDTTKEYVKEINKLSKIACAKKFKVIAPLIEKDKDEIVLLGVKMGVDLKNTFSCYVGKDKHCGDCLACKLRQEGFHWSGVEDLTEYN